jgi:flagellar basal body-associated protein FliL
MVDLVEDVGEDEQGQEPAKKTGFFSLSKIIIIAVVLTLLGGGFIGSRKLFLGKDKKPDPFLYALIGKDDEPIVVGVRGTHHTRTLMCRVTLKLESEEMVAEFEKKKDEFVDMLIRILQKYEIDELDFAGQNKVRRDIEDEFNLNLESGKVLKVLFTEFLIT